jgi:hypothetical protein
VNAVIYVIIIVDVFSLGINIGIMMIVNIVKKKMIIIGGGGKLCQII